MQSINTQPAWDYNKKAGDFQASVAFSYSSGANTLTVTDNTTYPSGDSREVVNVTVHDKFGSKVDAQITDSPDNVVISLASLNKTEGLSVEVTLASVKGFHKDGSIHDVATLKTTGDFNMKY